MKSARSLNNIISGTQIKMIGIAEYNLCFYLLNQVGLGNGFHRAFGAHRHKYGGFDGAVVGLKAAQPGFGCVAALN